MLQSHSMLQTIQNFFNYNAVSAYKSTDEMKNYYYSGEVPDIDSDGSITKFCYEGNKKWWIMDFKSSSMYPLRVSLQASNKTLSVAIENYWSYRLVASNSEKDVWIHWEYGTFLYFRLRNSISVFWSRHKRLKNSALGHGQSYFKTWRSQ